MRNPVLKGLFGVILSAVIAFALFMLVEGVGSLLHPWPVDFSGSFEEIAQQVESYPVWVLVLLGGFGYAAIMLICTFTATSFGHNRTPWYGYGVGLFLFSMVVFNLSKLPYPTWYWVLMFAVLPPSAYFGTKLATKGKNYSE